MEASLLTPSSTINPITQHSLSRTIKLLKKGSSRPMGTDLRLALAASGVRNTRAGSSPKVQTNTHTESATATENRAGPLKERGAGKMNCIQGRL